MVKVKDKEVESWAMGFEGSRWVLWRMKRLFVQWKDLRATPVDLRLDGERMVEIWLLVLTRRS